MRKKVSSEQFVSFRKKKPVYFTKRELQIIRMVCKGKTSGEIGEKLSYSSRTVEGWRVTIQERMGVEDVIGFVIYAIKTGIFKI
jgi:DNA-binding NarL/FixJ family response regulator